MSDRCKMCGLVFFEPSLGGPGICPECDCGNFGPAKIKRQAEYITQLKTRLKELPKYTFMSPLIDWKGVGELPYMTQDKNGEYIKVQDLQEIFDE